MQRVQAVMLALSAAMSIPALAAVEISTDITVGLGGTLIADEDVVEDIGGASIRIDLGSLPTAADVIGYSVAPGGDVVFSLDIATSLPGGIDVTPRDVVGWNGSTYFVVFRGADHSIPPGAKIDAIGYVEGDLLLSFDVTVRIGNVSADDEDLLRLESTQPDVWTLYFDGSAKGVPTAADLDGADVLGATGNLALSFDISGWVGGVFFDDEDILEFDPLGDNWSKRFDGSDVHVALASAAVDALFVPEPGGLAGAAVALLAIVALRARARP